MQFDTHTYWEYKPNVKKKWQWKIKKKTHMRRRRTQENNLFFVVFVILLDHFVFGSMKYFFFFSIGIHNGLCSSRHKPKHFKKISCKYKGKENVFFRIAQSITKWQKLQV